MGTNAISTWPLVLAAGVLCHVSVHAASFDCAKARSVPEKLICGDPELSRQDEALAKQFAAARARAADKAAFAKDATAAWHRREAACTDAACVSAWMSERQSVYERELAAPVATSLPGGRPVQAVRGLGQQQAPSSGDPARDDRDQKIAEAQRCIDFSQRSIDAEKEIGETVGYVNKVALYQAGRNLLICRKELEVLRPGPARR